MSRRTRGGPTGQPGSGQPGTRQFGTAGGSEVSRGGAGITRKKRPASGFRRMLARSAADTMNTPRAIPASHVPRATAHAQGLTVMSSTVGAGNGFPPVEQRNISGAVRGTSEKTSVSTAGATSRASSGRPAHPEDRPRRRALGGPAGDSRHRRTRGEPPGVPRQRLDRPWVSSGLGST